MRCLSCGKTTFSKNLTEPAVSSLVGSILIVLLVIVLTAVMYALISGLTESYGKTAYVVAEAELIDISPGIEGVVLTHQNGDTMYYKNQNTDAQYEVKFMVDTRNGLSEVRTEPSLISDSTWTAGDRIIIFRAAGGYYFTTDKSKITEAIPFPSGPITVQVIDNTHSQLIEYLTAGNAKGIGPTVVPTPVPTTIQPPVAVVIIPTSTTSAPVPTPCPEVSTNFSMDLNSGTAPLTIRFTDLSSGGNIRSWLWNFGDGTPESVAQNSIHTFVNPGTYEVTLTSTNNCGRSASVRHQVTVAGTPGFSVSGWVRFTSPPKPTASDQQWATIVVDGNTDNNRRFHLQHDQQNTRFEFAFQTAQMATNGQSATWIQSGQGPEVNQWYHVAGVYNQNDGRARLYVNRAVVSSRIYDLSGIAPSPRFYQVGGPSGIRFSNTNNQRKLKGDVLGLKTSDYAVSDASILQMYNAGPS